MQLALVLWTGGVGGAEQFTATLAYQLRACGVEPTVVFLGSPQPLSQRLEEQSVAYRSLALARGSFVLVHPRRLAKLVTACGRTGAIIDSSGYVGAALRAGGYRGRVVSVEHGDLVQTSRTLTRWKRIVRTVSRRTCMWATDVEVAVSDFVLATLLAHPHAREVVRIHNGVDLGLFTPLPRASSPDDVFSIGWVGRMIHGKGLFELLHAVSMLRHDIRVQVRFAGDGPERERVEELVKQLQLVPHVRFAGSVLDVPGFWAECDIGAFPTNESVESFSVATVEAMACGRPVVASRSGALQEVVEDGKTGTLVKPADVLGLSNALRRYALDEPLRAKHGAAARRACEARFDIRDTTKRYLALFEPGRSA